MRLILSVIYLLNWSYDRMAETARRKLFFGFIIFFLTSLGLIPSILELAGYPGLSMLAMASTMLCLGGLVMCRFSYLSGSLDDFMPASVTQKKDAERKRKEKDAERKRKEKCRKPASAPPDPMASQRTILGIGASATDAEAKAAFRRIAMKWHPDRNSSPDAAEEFRRAKSALDAICGRRSA